MIRVLHVLNRMDRGGAETFIMNVYRKIDRSKVQFDFLLHTQDDCAYNSEITALGGKIFSVPPRNKGILKNKRALDKFFSEHKEYKVVHQHVSSLSYVEPLKVAKKHGVPVRIIHGHSTREGGSFVHKYFHNWNKNFIKSFATHCFACSDLAAKWLCGDEMYNKGKVSIIKNGIDTSSFIFNKQHRKEIRESFGIDNKFVLGHMGRFIYAKNHDFLIDVFKAVHDSNEAAVLLLVGDGEKRPLIEKKVSELNLSDSVIFTGVREDISKLLSAMDIFIFPSNFEGLPVSLVEAQAAGLPCLISDKITDDIMITDHIEKMPLDKGSRAWTDRILEYYCQGLERKVEGNDVIHSGYDISETVKILEGIYL